MVAINYRHHNIDVYKRQEENVKQINDIINRQTEKLKGELN